MICLLRSSDGEAREEGFPRFPLPGSEEDAALLRRAVG